jgi:hypothetical protein
VAALRGAALSAPETREQESEDEVEREPPKKTLKPLVVGFDYARWVRERIAGGVRPVPPHGFEPGAVIGACTQAWKLRSRRLLGVAASIAAAAAYGWAEDARWSPLLIGLWLSFFLDRTAAHRSLRQSMNEDPNRWRTSAGLSRSDRLRMARMTATEGQPVLPYQTEPRKGRVGYHFIGAGNVWYENTIGMDVMPAQDRADDEEARADRIAIPALLPTIDQLVNGRRSGKVKQFTPDDLLDYIGHELDRAALPDREFHPDNRQDVFTVAAISAKRWPGLTEEQWTNLVTLAHDGVRAVDATPTPKVARRFLCARMVSWDGEVVASLFVGVAYENLYLRVIVRPQVLNPLDERLRALVDAQLRLSPWALRRSCALLALRDLGCAGLGLIRPGARTPLVPSGDPGPTRVASLREVYAAEYMDDMLQFDDARRYITMMQGRVFSAVQAFLKDHNIDTAGYEAQLTLLINQCILSASNVEGSHVQSGNINSNIRSGGR